jgi:DNA-binding protein YbaB
MIQDFEDLLSSTRAELGRMRAAEPAPDDGFQPVVGRGTALDGRIEVEMAADGRLSGLALDSSVMRMDERMLAREIMAAVNVAWAARRGADESAAAVAAIDPAVLQQRLTEVQDQGMASMRRFTDGMQAVLDTLESRVPR